jgi:hypothetical protein
MFLLSRTECPSYAVFLSQDRDTQRVYRLPVFAKYQLIRPGVAYWVADRVNWAGKFHLVIESVRLAVSLLLLLLTAREGSLCSDLDR